MNLPGWPPADEPWGARPEQAGLEMVFGALQSRCDLLIEALDAHRKIAVRARDAAKVGDVAAARRASAELAKADGQIANAVRAVSSRIPTDEYLQDVLSSTYTAELVEVGRSEGVAITELDGRLFAFPLTIEVHPETRTVKLGKKSFSALRPSTIVEQIRKAMQRPRTKPERFIELLWSAARLVNAQNAVTSGVHVADVYEAITLYPEVKKNYTPLDFTVDLFTLDTSHVTSTKKGARVVFSGATGAKGSARTLSIVGPDGRPRHYVGVRFEEQQ